MISTNIGAISLTNNQILNWSPSGIWVRFSYIGGEVIALSETQPSQNQINALIAELGALPDTVPQRILIEQFNFKTLWGTIWASALSQTGLVNLPGYQTTIQDMWYYPNRSAIYPYMQALIQAGKGTQGDLVIIIQAFADQGIDITTIQ